MNNNNFVFLQGGGEMGKLIRSTDWSKTPIGSPDNWPAELRNSVSLMLNNLFPMYIAWGPDYTQLYNDGYRPILGVTKHPQAMGIGTRETFPEIWYTIGPMFAGVMRGEAVGFPNFMLPLERNGYVEECYFDFCYSPIKYEDGAVGGVLVTVIEITEKYKAFQSLDTAKRDLEISQAETKKERDRLKRFFMQAPAGICVLDGQELVFELVNPLYQELFPCRKLLGKPLLNAVPEITGQPIWGILQEVYRTGKTYEGHKLLIPLARTDNGQVEDRYFDFIYQARRDENDLVDGILVFVFEVTGMINVQNELREARQQSEQQKRVYETITSATPDLMYVFDLEYRFTFANSALLSMWGKTWENAVGKGLLENGYELWHAEMHEKEIDQVVATKKPIRGEVSFPHATLGTRYYDYIFTPVLSKQGEVEAVAGTTRDITERKHWEQRLKKTSEELYAINKEMAASYQEQAASNERLSAANRELAIVNEQLGEARQKIEESEAALRQAINAANFGTWRIHSVTRQFITNARLKELFGYYADEEMNIEQALAQITDEYRGIVAKKLENAIYHNGDYDVTYPVIGFHDNQLRWLRAIGNLKVDPSGAFSAFTGVVMDITESHIAAQIIERAEESLRMAIDSAELATWFLNEKSGTIVASERFNELLGFRPGEQVPYETALNQIPPEYRTIVQEAVSVSFATGANFKVEYPVMGLHDDKQRWVRSVGKFVADEKNGNYITGVMADITEQKMDDIRKNDFIGMVSHELKTPLTTLTAVMQIARLKLQNSDNKPLVNVIERGNIQVKRMTSMITGFLDVSRFEAGKILVVKQPFDLSQLLHEVLGELELITTTHKFIRVECEPVLVNADRDKITSVISNLISNAVKYSDNNTPIIVSCESHQDEVVVSVRDQGMGIRPEDLTRIFSRYYRTETVRKSHISGFGIGLYLSNEIIKQHNGSIWAESEFGAGSTFCFSLPLK